MVKIKICGVRDVRTALFCARSGADYIGLVLTESPRRIELETAKEISSSLINFPGRPQVVGVFVNQDYAEVNSIIRYCGLDVAQLSGNESTDYLARIEAPCIKSIHVLPSTTENDLMSRVESLNKTSQGRVRVLLDSRPDDRFGGSGAIFNWELAAKICSSFPIMVAGGLRAQNVSEIIEKLHPWGIDVSSGVENKGIKDTALITEFITAVLGNILIAGGQNE